jgi:hypothetical protein
MCAFTGESRKNLLVGFAGLVLVLGLAGGLKGIVGTLKAHAVSEARDESAGNLVDSVERCAALHDPRGGVEVQRV